MKALGEENVILGIKLVRFVSNITWSQSHYIDKVLAKYGYQDYKHVATSFDPSVLLTKNKSEPVDQDPYA